MWLETLQVRNLRSIQRADLELDPRLNVLFGKKKDGDKETKTNPKKDSKDNAKNDCLYGSTVDFKNE